MTCMSWVKHPINVLVCKLPGKIVDVDFLPCLPQFAFTTNEVRTIVAVHPRRSTSACRESLKGTNKTVSRHAVENLYMYSTGCQAGEETSPTFH